MNSSAINKIVANSMKKLRNSYSGKKNYNKEKQEILKDLLFLLLRFKSRKGIRKKQ